MILSKFYIRVPIPSISRLSRQKGQICRACSTSTHSPTLRSRDKLAPFDSTKILPSIEKQTPEQLRQYLESAAQSLQVSTLEDWYRIQSRDFSQLHDVKGRSFLEVSGFRLSEALQKAYPDHKWELWRFDTTPQGFWTDPASATEFFESVRNGRSIDCLYDMSMRDIVKLGGQGLLQLTNSSVLAALRRAYPDHTWKPHKFKNVPKNHWASIENQRDLFDDIFKQLEFKEMSDWYSITVSTLRQMKAWAIVGNYYNSSISRALATIYPNHPWDLSRFVARPTDSAEVSSRDSSKLIAAGALEPAKKQALPHQDILIHVSKSLEIGDSVDAIALNYEKWYSVTPEQLKSIKIRNLRFENWLKTHYKSSIPRALMSNFPSIPWEEWRFANVTPKFWEDMNNQRKFLDAIAKQLHLSSMSEWYSVSISTMNEKGGGSLLARYGSSLSQMITTVYPDHQWEAWRFAGAGKWVDSSSNTQLNSSHSALDANASEASSQASSAPTAASAPIPPISPKAQRESDPHYAIRGFMNDIGKRLGVQQLDDWYRISVQQLSDAGASHILLHFGGLPGVLKILHPQHKWSPKVFALAAKRAVQRQLRLRLEALFPGHEVIEEFNLGVKFVRKDRYIGFDAYVPDLKLAFEYQGEVHYRDIQSVGQRDVKRDNDAEKAAVCTKHQIKLVEVPYTWDSEEASLVEIIRRSYPEILTEWKPKYPTS